MRRLALVAAISFGAGCPQSSGPCQTDHDCGGTLLCTRDFECLPANEVRQVKVTWTIGGMPASATTCATTPDFTLTFIDTFTHVSFGYEPVPCMEGQFTIDRIPTSYNFVEINVTLAPIDANNSAALAIP